MDDCRSNILLPALTPLSPIISPSPSQMRHILSLAHEMLHRVYNSTPQQICRYTSVFDCLAAAVPATLLASHFIYALRIL